MLFSRASHASAKFARPQRPTDGPVRIRVDIRHGRFMGTNTMRNKPVAASVFAFALLLIVAVVVLTFRSFATGIQIHYLKSFQSGQFTAATFEMINRSSDRYFVFPQAIDAEIGRAWKTCAQFDTPPQWELRPYAEQPVTLEMTKLPSGPRLRLHLSVVKELRGWKGLPGRFRLKYVDKLSGIPFFPRDENLAVGSHEISMVSDEFVSPPPTTKMAR
jgi:hypothetical protein